MKKIMVFLLAAVVAVMGLSMVGCGEDATVQQKYTVYFDLTDATRGEQIITVTNAQAKIRESITDSGISYVESLSKSGTVENGKVCESDVLVYEFFNADKAALDSVVSSLKKNLNLKSVLVEQSQPTYSYVQ